jgi:Fe-S oxidoreductase
MEFAGWERILLAVLIAAVVVAFTREVLFKVGIIRKGRRDFERTDDIPRRLWTAVKEVFFHTRVISGRPVVGVLHLAVFGGFVFFGLETLDHFLKAFGVPFLKAFLPEAGVRWFKVYIAVWAVLVLVGIVGLAFRRFALVKISPDPKSWSSGVVAIFIVVLMATFLLAQTDLAPGAAKANWWTHALFILGFPPLILRSKHFHLLMAPVDIFLRAPRLGDLRPLDLDVEALEESEEEPYLGLETLGSLSWKERMDFFTCVECRRCTDNCPANLSGQDLDPRGFILDGRRAILELGDEEAVVGNVISEVALGQCTSCGACEAACPVGIEHLQVLVGAKQSQALATGTGMVASDFLKTVERSSNAFGEPADARGRLIAELEIPLYQAGETEYLLWLGCVWGYNEDARRSLESMVKILKASGVTFGVLPEESCSGHHSRRQGEELQFQTLAQENLERLGGASVQKIVAPCPHCLHTFSKEYPALDESFQPEVIHHSELIEDLLASGRLQVDGQAHGGRPATYHDPCYLGRFEKVYEPPRRALGRTGLKILEMDRSRERSMCCGGGSAGFVREQEVARRVDQERSDQVRATGARLLVTGCPECKMMLGSAVEETKDLAEVVADAMV